MNKEFFFYNCCLEGRQLELGETGFLAAKEVVRAICDTDFRNNGLYLKDPCINASYHHEFAKRPKDGLYLMRALKANNDTSLDVLIDTRLFPSFVLIEKNNNKLQMSMELTKVVERSLNHAANKYGWLAKLKENQLNVVHDVDLFYSAMAYMKDDATNFMSFVNYEERTQEILQLLHLMLDNKNRPKTIMRITVAAIDAGIIEKPEYVCFIEEFMKERIISLSTFKYYTKRDTPPLMNDKVYQEYLDKFLRLKDKWLDEFS